MSHGHALVVTKQSKHALILNNHSISLLRLRKQSHLVLHRLHHRLQHGRLVRRTNRPRKVKLLQRLPSRVLGRHHHETEVLEHLHGITIGVTRKVHRLLPPHAEEKVNLFLRHGILVDALVRGCHGGGARSNRHGNIHGIVRISLQCEPVQQEQFGIRLLSIRNVNLLHLTISPIGIQNHLLVAILEEPISAFACVDERPGEGRVINEVGVRDHGEAFSHAKVPEADGTRE
mmetsp:Transcript_26356/g.47769  ORF Transcript_26356/g.47769 Transcript_26356/m.47769 type:complete len:231 (+) Transcript_26356:235-927(+)